MSRSDGGEHDKQREQDKEKVSGKPDNVVQLGTEALLAIAEELRRMYDADLRSRPSERLERLIRKIESGEDLSAEPDGRT